ncbi:pre-mRNA splicing regulator USH1G-like [Ornithodoros turicata]
MDRDKFHRAARDGYLDLLREATRKDCNTPDEDGMTPTIWAAYHGHLDALRLLVGRGGDPDKCDHYGNTALHCAAANGHINCVSFLVSFGVNLWALDNDFHTAKDIASLNQREELLRFLDQAISKQSALNKKLVQRLKEKALRDAEKRQKSYQKLTRKAAKKAEKDEKVLERQRQKMTNGDMGTLNGGTTIIPINGIRKDSHLLYQTPKFSDIVSNNSTTVSSKKGLGAVSKKIILKKQSDASSNGSGEFKVRGVESDGKKSIRSLTGLRRDTEVLFVPKAGEDANGNRLPRLKDVFDATSELSRAISEPDFKRAGDVEPGSIFERPGFGSVAFRNSISGTLLSLPTCRMDEEDEDDGEESVAPSDSVVDSIGSAGSLAQRTKPWDEDEDESETMPVLAFLSAHGLTEYIPLFTHEKVDLEALMLLGEDDLKSMGVPLGPRKKLLRAIELRRDALEDPGEVLDSKL